MKFAVTLASIFAAAASAVPVPYGNVVGRSIEKHTSPPSVPINPLIMAMMFDGSWKQKIPPPTASDLAKYTGTDFEKYDQYASDKLMEMNKAMNSLFEKVDKEIADAGGAEKWEQMREKEKEGMEQQEELKKLTIHGGGGWGVRGEKIE